MLPRLLTISTFLLAMAYSPGSIYGGEKPKPTDYEVKAAYIYNFAKFIDWPQSRFPDRNANIDVCVLGNDQLGQYLAKIEGKSTGDRRIGFKRNTSLETLRECEILFIDNSQMGKLDKILEAANGSSILTVGDTKGFAQRGVTINFYLENNKMRFEINLQAANRAGLKIRSNLLNIAKIVTGP
jgi:hypothetical protein